jgi:asparagine synthase (glutamine-hydrolysing)
MCGVSVIIALDLHGRRHAARDKAETSERLTSSLEKIKHRGPDSQGQWISRDGRVSPLPLIQLPYV